MRSNEFRVFLSSTFTDLQPEREQLVKKVFPRIRAKCRERGVEFTEIDLRWGITTEESRSGKVVRICLEEIDRCPYFIGILGSRYGWVPGIDELEKDPEILRQYPWLREFADDAKSIVEMEFTHGAIEATRERAAFFYEQKSHLDTIAESERIAFDGLKRNLQSRELPYRPFYAPEELGEHVYRDLISILDRDWPAKKELTPLETEQRLHDAFALNRTRAYVANPEYYERFERFVAADEGPLLLWGKSGLGKSALMAYLTTEYKSKHPEAFVIRNFIGATAGASRAEDVIRHIMMEIAARYELPDEVPNDDAKLHEEFPSWLAKVRTGETLILAIDAVNQLSGIGPEMHWLPQFIPANVRLIVSTTPEVPLEQLRKRGWGELEIQPLDATRRKRISEEFLARYHKSLAPEQIEVIAEESKLDSPLFLRTLLEELRVFGVHEAVEVHLAGYLACENERELFQRVLARMEADHGEEVVRNVMAAIYASRFGLTETELIEITGLSRLALSEFLIALEFHLMQRAGLYTFFHNYLREAVELRYLSNGDAKKSRHHRIGEYFSSREFATRRRDEEPWQWQQSEDLDALKECLLRPQMAALYSTDHEAYEAYSYWKSLPEIAFGTSYIEWLKSDEIDVQTSFDAYKNIISLLITAGSYDAAAEFLDAGLPVFAGQVDTYDLLAVQETRAELETHRGRYDSAIELANALLTSNEAILESRYELKHKLLDSLSVSYYSIGKYEEAETIARQQVVISTEKYGPNSYETAKEYKNLGAFLMAGGKLEESEAVCSNALTLFANLFGETHPETTLCRMNLGSCLALQRRLEDATREFGIAEKGLQVLLGPEHVETLSCRNNIAYLLSEQGKIKEARSIALDLLARYAKILGDEALKTSVVGILVGYTYYLEKEYETAKNYYERYLPVRIKIQGESHPDVIRFRDRLEEINRALQYAK